MKSKMYFLVVSILVSMASFCGRSYGQTTVEKWRSAAPRMGGAKFELRTTVPSTYSTWRNSITDQTTEAFPSLLWADPPEKAPDGSWVDIKKKQLWDKLVDLYFLLGPGRDYIDAPLPYYLGQPDFEAIAKDYADLSHPNADYFNPQAYLWQASPGASSDSPPGPLHTDSWNFGAVKRDTADEAAIPEFPITTWTKVKVSQEGVPEPSLNATSTIKWYPAWVSTETGLQNTITLGPTDVVKLPDGTVKFADELHVGDAIMCWVRGEVGFLGDENHKITVRPDLNASQVQPQPDERLESRDILLIDHLSDGGVVLTMDAIPHIDPENDPEAPGYNEIQQTKLIDQKYQETLATGKTGVALALNGYVLAAEQVSIGRFEGWAVENSIKAVIEAGELAEKAVGAGKAAERWESTADDMRSVTSRLRDLEARGLVSTEKTVLYEKKLSEYDRDIVRLDHAASDARNAEQKAINLSNRINEERAISPNDLVRQSALNEVTPEEQQEIANLFESVGGDPSKLRFNQGSKTGYLDDEQVINIRGDINPREDGITATATMDKKLALAHELGHMKTHGSPYPPNSWQDELLAARWAVANANNLSNDERRFLLLDICDKARVNNAWPEFWDGPEGLTEAERTFIRGG